MAVVIVILQAIVFQLFGIRPKTALRLCPPCFALGAASMAFAAGPLWVIIGYGPHRVLICLRESGHQRERELVRCPPRTGNHGGLFVGGGHQRRPCLLPLFGTAVYQLAPNAPMILGMITFALLSIYALTIDSPDVVVRTGETS